MFALLNIDKPRGVTSYDVVRLVKRLLPRGERIGHAGTLDPAAEGVLIVCLGPATRLVDLIQSYDKEYVTVGRLGGVSTTDDGEGRITLDPTAAAPDEPTVRAAVEKFVGAIQQVPPAHSAVKVEGQRAYKLARRGETLALTARTVHIHDITVEGYAWPELKLRVRCGSGTYVRSILRDVGAALGVGGYCLSIERTRIGPFRREQAVRPEQLSPENLQQHLIPPQEAVPVEARIAVTAEQVAQIALGRTIEVPHLPPEAAAQAVLGGLDPDGNLAALLRPAGGGMLHPEKVFVVPRSG